MKFCRDTFEVDMKIQEAFGKERGFANLNSIISDAIKKWGIRAGIGVIRSKHTTAGIIEQEDEDGILYHDLPWLLDQLVPEKKENKPYEHDNLERRMPRVGPDERKNGKAHLEQTLISRSVSFIVHDYRLDLGSWPSIIFIDSDPSGRKSREVEIAIIGE